MTPSIPHGVALPPGTYAVDETTPREALEHLLQKAAATGESSIDSIEVAVSEGEDLIATLSFWPVTWAARKQLADALNLMAAEILKTKGEP